MFMIEWDIKYKLMYVSKDKYNEINKNIFLVYL